MSPLCRQTQNQDIVQTWTICHHDAFAMTHPLFLPSWKYVPSAVQAGFIRVDAGQARLDQWISGCEWPIPFQDVSLVATTTCLPCVGCLVLRQSIVGL